jgi:hypothetical protein
MPFWVGRADAALASLDSPGARSRASQIGA